MPYIITTRAYATSSACPREPAPRTRRAVATLDGVPGEPLRNGAQYAVDELIEEHGGSIDEWPNLTEQGGTIGPLPDGTVIEVARVRLLDLAVNVPGDTLGSEAAIIDAYNAKQAA